MAVAHALPQVFAASCEAKLAGGGFFPHVQGPRVGWVGVGQGTLQLRACAKRLGSLLESMEIAIDPRPYKPHVTLFRVRDTPPRREDPWGELQAHLEQREWPVAWVERLVLWKSVLRPEGAQHVALAQVARAGQDHAWGDAVQ